jgi:hypothetical protein
MRMIRILCSIIFVAAPGVRAGELSTPLRATPITRNFGDQAVPRSERGFFLAHDFARGAVFAWDKSGKLVLDTVILPPGAARVMIHDVSISPKGTYAVAASAISEKGAPIAFLALLDASGKIDKLVQTASTGLFRVSFADDGTLWALVREFDGQFEELPNYDMLRHYDENGRLLNTALPRKHFKHRGFPAPLGELTVSQDRIGVYADAVKVWVELSPAGEILGHWRLPSQPDPKNLEIGKVALTASGEVYVSAAAKRTRPWDFGIYRFDKPSGTLERVGTSAVSGAAPLHMFGSDGDQLVLTTDVAIPTLLWAKPR